MTQEQIAAMVKRLRGAGKHPMIDGNCKVDVYVAHEAADMLEQLASERGKVAGDKIKAFVEASERLSASYIAAGLGGASLKAYQSALAALKEKPHD